jgi:hypothetical protein
MTFVFRQGQIRTTYIQHTGQLLQVEEWGVKRLRLSITTWPDEASAKTAFEAALVGWSEWMSYEWWAD